jgi:hypothetical protein
LILKSIFHVNNTYKLNSYLTENTQHLFYKYQPVNAVQENNRCLIWESYCHVSQWLKTGFGLVNGFIAYLQVATTNNYNTVTDFPTTTKQSTLIPSVYLHWSSRIYNTGTIKVSLNHTLPKPVHYSTHKVFTGWLFILFCSLPAYCYPLVCVLLPLPLTRNCSEHSWTLTYTAAERTCVTENTCHVITTCCCVTSQRTRKTQLPLLLRVGPCLQSCCLATCWSDPLYYYTHKCTIWTKFIISRC